LKNIISKLPQRKGQTAGQTEKVINYKTETQKLHFEFELEAGPSVTIVTRPNAKVLSNWLGLELGRATITGLTL
jgi:(p)ppGpp synthase/HD superfamily hydrolase